MKPSYEPFRAAVGGSAGLLRRAAFGAALLLWLPRASLHAQVPQLLNYQGRVQVGTTDFNGTGQFKFALVNADGTATYWSNDGTPAGQPAAAVTLPVTKGLYSVLLGNTALPNMQAVPPAALANSYVHLRVWFNDGLNGFQQFVPDQRIAAAAYAVTALNAVNAVTAGSLTGPISVDQLPPGVPRATNGTTTIAGNVVVQGTLIGDGVPSLTAVGSSGLPAGTTFEVLIDNIVEPEVRVELLTMDKIRLRRPTTDLSWSSRLFERRGGTGQNTGTNVPVSFRLTLPNGGISTWTVVDGPGGGPAFIPDFRRLIGSDLRPYDQVTLQMDGGADGFLVRSNLNVSGSGSPPRILHGGPVSGQPVSSSMRLTVDGVSHNYVIFSGRIFPEFDYANIIHLNPTFHTALSAWALGEEPKERSAEIVLLNGLPGTPTSLAKTPLGVTVHPIGYSLHFAADGLPVEVISITAGK